MNRRTFNKLLGIGLGTLDHSFMKPLMKKKEYISKESHIGLIAPSGRLTQTKLQKAKKNLDVLGLKYTFSKYAAESDGYFAGTDAMRIHDLHAMYDNPEIDAIWCIRGGYGVTRIVDHLDYDLIGRNPKPIIGYSDITTLLAAIYQKTGNACYHGPVAASTMSEYTIDHLKPIYGLDKDMDIELSKSNIEMAKEKTVYQYRVINPGKAKGKLVGGNLSLLSAMVGTRHALQAKNKLVFLEDIGEEPYRVDRMLTQLISSGFFEGVRGVFLGVFAGCHKKDEHSKTLIEVISERIKRIEVPSAYGFSFGHIDDQCTFRFGQEAELNTEARTIRLFA